MKIEFDRLFFPRKNTQIPNFMKIRSVGAELFQPDEQTDRRTDFFNTPKKKD